MLLLALPGERPADRALARQLWLQGLELEARFELDSAIVSYRRATRADATFFAAFLDYLQATRFRGNPLLLRQEIGDRLDLTAAERRCLLSVARLADDGSPRWLPEFRALREELGPTPCVLYGLTGALQAVPLTRGTPTAEEIQTARALSRQLPGHPAAAIALVAALQRVGKHRDGFEAALSAARASEHIVHRQRIEVIAAGALNKLRDSVRLVALMERGDSIARADGRPLIRYEWLVLLRGNHPAIARRRQAQADELQLARLARTRVYEVQTLINVHSPLVEAGRMNEVLAAIQPLAPWVERHELHEIAMRLRHLEGRALVRSGRPRAAIAALDKSLRAGQLVGNAQFIAEAYHQLTHANEALADWPAAAAASRHFVAKAQQTADPGIRVSSYNDAATVHWKAGWNAASDSLYRLMVRAIEREGVHFAFAAEYFERVGRFADAMRYVSRAARPLADGHVPDGNVVYATLTRLHLALGNVDSAMVFAARHDSIPYIADEVLVPRVLVARGEHARAVETMRRWTDLQAARGNVRGQVKALLSLAEALLPVAPDRAANVAYAADSVATAFSFAAERVTALRLRGEGLTKVDAAAAVPVLAVARQLGRAHATALERILVDVAYGAALERNGDPGRALAAYEVAIHGIEAMERTAEHDVMRARFRAARTDAFNGALRVVTPGADAPHIDALLRWSARKKRLPGGTSAVPSAAAIRRRLPPRHALVDYVVIDNSILATVVTRDAQATVRLPLGARDVQSMAEGIVLPFGSVHGGRVDLGRAPFDTVAARALHSGLVAPLLSHLAGVSVLTIVPDAPIHAVPFDALLAGDHPSRFLIDRFTLSYALAPGVPEPATIRRDAPLMLLAGDAPGAVTEREGLPGIWGGRVAVLDGAQASESRVVERRQSGGILHVASHARSNDREPLASYLALTGDAQHDGMLHYAEIERLKSRYDLVVLNACETSAGALLAGSGFMSLGRAFLVSGSRNVIATQWPVGAASAALAGRFYAALQRGLSADAALREAKLSLRREPATAHPFFWASHVLLQR